MKVACIQLDSLWENPKANCQKVQSLLRATPLPPGTLIVLPEMFATGFSMNLPVTAEKDPSPTENFLKELAVQGKYFVLGGLVKVDSQGRAQNQAVLLSPEGKLIARYSKIHPFTPGTESQHHHPGSELVLADCGGFMTAPFVCYDLRFPEIFRAATKRGAQLMIVIASWPVARVAHWTTLLQARAIENQAYVVGVNRCGKDPNFNYPGRSMVVAPSGEVLLDAGSEEGVFHADIDLQTLTEHRRTLPFLKDLRDEWVK